MIKDIISNLKNLNESNKPVYELEKGKGGNFKIIGEMWDYLVVATSIGDAIKKYKKKQRLGAIGQQNIIKVIKHKN